MIRRRARRVGAPLREVAPAPVLGWDRDTLTRRPAAARRRPRSGCADATRRRTRPWRTRRSMRSPRPASPRCPTRSAGAGYRAATWPGRLELLELDGGREVLLDGAHNPAGAAALAQALDDLRPFLRPGDVTLVMAMMADKDVASAVGALAAADALRGARVVTTQVEGGRAMAAEDLADGLAGGAARRRGRRDPVARRGTGAGASRRASGPVVVAGSLYLVGAVRGSSSTTRASRIQTPRHEPPAPAPRTDARRPPHVRVGLADVRDGDRQRDPRFLLRRRRARGRRPGRGGRGSGAPGRRRGRRRHRHRGRVDPARSLARRRRGGSASRRPDRRRDPRRPARRVPQHRHDQGGASPRRRSMPAPALVNDVWGVAADEDLLRLVAERRVPARAHAQPRGAALHDAAWPRSSPISSGRSTGRWPPGSRGTR